MKQNKYFNNLKNIFANYNFIIIFGIFVPLGANVLRIKEVAKGNLGKSLISLLSAVI